MATRYFDEVYEVNAATDRKEIRAAVVYRVCQHWRAPMFARLNAAQGVSITVLHGKSVPGTKLVNAESFPGFEHREMFTLAGRARSSGRAVPWVFCPTVLWHLWRVSPDVVLVEGGSNVFTNVLVYLYAKIFRRRLVWWTLGEIPGRQYRGLSKAYRTMVLAMERGADALLGYSSVALRYFGRTGHDLQKCFRAVNCVDTEQVDREIAQRRDNAIALRSDLGLTEKKVVLFVGALTDVKRIDRLIAAMPRIASCVKNVHLLIVGDGPERLKLEDAAKRQDVNDCITFVGAVVHGVSDFFETADVFVLPGLGGLAVSEALAHGVPVVCTRGDGCEVDLVRNGENGYRLASDDDGAIVDFIANRVTEILGDDVRLAEMKRKAREVIDEEHNVKTYIANIVDAIRYAKSGRRETPLPEAAEDAALG